MEVKTFAAALGISVVAGAATAMLLPKDSKVYQTANNAVHLVKDEVADAVQSMKSIN